MRFVSQRENFATEALAYILNSSALSRGALHRFVAERVASFSPISRVSTQEAVSAESRPDVTLVGEDGRTIAYLEAKFWAGLTDAQPVDYLRRLGAVNGQVLIFMAPERRLASLRAELLERCRAAGLSVELGASVLVVDGIHVVVVSWGQVLAALLTAAESGDERAAAADIAQLASLCASAESEGFIPLSRAELDDLDAPRRIISLVDVADAIVERGVSEGVLKKGRLRPAHSWHSAGRYVAFRRAGAWIGLSHRRWLDLGHPLWVRFDEGTWGRAQDVRRAVESLLVREPPAAFVVDGTAVVLPLVVPAGVSKDAVVASGLAQLRAIEGLLERAGMSELSQQTPPSEDDPLAST
jgi:hypothetical protein